MGQQSAHSTEGPCCSALATTATVTRIPSDSFDFSKTWIFWHNLKQSWKLRECLGSNSDHGLPTENSFGPPKVGFIFLSTNQVRVLFPCLLNLYPFHTTWLWTFESNPEVFEIPSAHSSYLPIQNCIFLQFIKIFQQQIINIRQLTLLFRIFDRWRFK